MIPFPEGISPDIFTIAIGNFKFTLYWYALAYVVGILAWWPKIISNKLINLPRKGFINLHNSFLPFNRGKHPYFWAFYEDSPYGVTIHKVDEGIDW